MTLETILLDWLTLHSLDVKPRTTESYRYCIRHLSPLIGSKDLSTIQPADVKHALSSIIKAGHGRTAEMCYVMLKAALQDHPQILQGVKRPKHKQRRPTPLNDAQISLYLSACAVHQHGLALSLALTLGLRRGEICGLRWSDINLKESTITISNQRQRMEDGKIIDCPPKSESSYRELPIPAAIVRPIRAQWQLSGYVCNLSPSGLDAAHRRLTKDLSLPPITLHGLRHSMATAFVRHGGDLKTLQMILGHASYATTADIYTHPDVETMRKTLEVTYAFMVQ